MAENRAALIIACNKYTDESLNNLKAPGQDAEDLKKVLEDPAIGNFKVQISLNDSSYDVKQAIETFFSDRKRDDLVLLYFSGHGIKDADGKLYFATVDTNRKRLRSTSISASFINEIMLSSFSRRQVLLLDCCYSGAFARGMVAKADNSVGTKERFEGNGRVVLTASDAMQYSFEGDEAVGEGAYSVFTRILVHGIESGEADLDEDGWYSLDELYEYVHTRMASETPQQMPGKWAFEVQGNIFIGKNPKPKLVPEENLDLSKPKVSDEEAIDLSKWAMIHDSGEEGTCAAFAGIIAMEIFLAQKGHVLPLSARYVYEKSKKHDEMGNKSEGTAVTTMAYIIEHFGVPPESTWPYKPKARELPKGSSWKKLDAEASKYKARLYRLTSYDDVPIQLRLKRPIISVVKMYGDSWFQETKGQPGQIQYVSNSQLIGLHVIVIVAYDPKNKSIRFANSFGTKWGDHGFGSMNEDVAKALLDRDNMWAVEVEYSI